MEGEENGVFLVKEVTEQENAIYEFEYSQECEECIPPDKALSVRVDTTDRDEDENNSGYEERELDEKRHTFIESDAMADALFLRGVLGVRVGTLEDALRFVEVKSGGYFRDGLVTAQTVVRQ